MTCILHGIQTLTQHLIRIETSPDDYRPDCCPSCGKSGLWHHGRYHRQSDREHGSSDSLNPLPILRFLLSILQAHLLNAARMHCAEAMVSMAYPTGGAIHGFNGMLLRANHAGAVARTPHDQALGGMVEG